MTIELDPEAIEAAWQAGVAQGRAEIDTAGTCLSSARGHGMAGLANCLRLVADTFAGAGMTGQALIDEIGEDLTGALALWEATNHQVIGVLRALEAP